jgi:hypothetical protein
MVSVMKYRYRFAALLLCLGALNSIGVLCVLSAAVPEPGWLKEFESCMTQPGTAASGVGYLEKLTEAERRSADYHWALARAYQAVDKPCPAAEAIATYRILPAGTKRDLAPVVAWLATRSRASYERALAAHEAGDLKTAVKSFLVAVKCDPAVLSKDDHGLRALAGDALVRLVNRDPVRPEVRFHRAYYGVLFGETEAAVRGFEMLGMMETDLYKKWRAKVWLDRIRQDLKAGNVLAAVPPPISDAPPPPEPSHVDVHKQESRANAEERSMEVSEQLQMVTSSIQESEEKKHGKVSVDADGKVQVKGFDQRANSAQLAELQQKKAELEAERASPPEE